MEETLFGSVGLGGSVAIVILTLTTLYYYYLTYHFGYLEKQGVPVKKPKPLIGTMNLSKPLKDLDAENYKAFGRFYGVYDGRIPGLHVADPDLLRQITIKDFSVFPHSRDFTKMRGEKVTSNFMVALRGEQWKKVRNVITPSFTTGKLKHMTYLIDECCKSLDKRLEKLSENQEPFDVRSVVSALTIEIIGSCAFGVSFEQDSPLGKKFVQNTNRLISPPMWLMFIAIFLPSLFKFLTPESVGYVPQNFFADLARKILKTKEKEGKKRHDFLELLLEAEAEAKASGAIDGTEKILTDDIIIAQCALFLVAGHETTATTISFALYSLAMHPEIQDELVAEVDKVMNQHNDVLSYQAIAEMPYLGMVLDETLRMYPPFVRIEKTCVQEGYQLNGVTLMKGMVVGIPIYSIHHDPEFYPDPENFDPERFNPENKAKRHPMTYLPFGSGPRNCIAKRFALMEAKMTLASIIRRFRIKTCPETKIPPEFAKTAQLLQPKDMMLAVEKR